MENCIVCNTTNKKINDFVYKCEKCLFLQSNLKSGTGRQIDGISELRRKNFNYIIKTIKSLNISEKFKILEIGSGSGYFIEECIKSELDITGSEANDTMIKMLWMLNTRKGRPQKRKIITRINGYHGVTLGAASMTGKPYNGEFQLPLDGFIHADCPHY